MVTNSNQVEKIPIEISPNKRVSLARYRQQINQVMFSGNFFSAPTLRNFSEKDLCVYRIMR
jgi:hypothetical protein